MASSSIRYAYLHGFGSGPQSFKGVALREILAEDGIELELPDLNAPSLAQLTYSGSLAYLDAEDAGFDGKWRFIGSSMGGYLAARWAELNPHRVDRMVLLCPGFHLAKRWPSILGADAMERWKREGVMFFPDGTGAPTRVWWRFIEDSMTHPGLPEFTQPTTIIHGTEDDIVPLQSSIEAAETLPHVTLDVVDDDHGLASSVPHIASVVRKFLIHAPEPAQNKY